MPPFTAQPAAGHQDLDRLRKNLGRLACPVCHAALELAEDTPNSIVVCTGCMRRYPIVDGLPVLIAARALLQCIGAMNSTPRR